MVHCEMCKNELKSLNFSDAIKSRDWWVYEIKDFGWGNLLVILAIVLLFGGFMLEFLPKVKNPCDWCKVCEGDNCGTCSEWMGVGNTVNEFGNIIVSSNEINVVDYGRIKNTHP